MSPIFVVTLQDAIGLAFLACIATFAIGFGTVLGIDYLFKKIDRFMRKLFK